MISEMGHAIVVTILPGMHGEHEAGVINDRPGLSSSLLTSVITTLSWFTLSPFPVPAVTNSVPHRRRSRSTHIRHNPRESGASLPRVSEANRTSP